MTFNPLLCLLQTSTMFWTYITSLKFKYKYLRQQLFSQICLHLDSLDSQTKISSQHNHRCFRCNKWCNKSKFKIKVDSLHKLTNRKINNSLCKCSKFNNQFINNLNFLLKSKAIPLVLSSLVIKLTTLINSELSKAHLQTIKTNLVHFNKLQHSISKVHITEVLSTFQLEKIFKVRKIRTMVFLNTRIRITTKTQISKKQSLTVLLIGDEHIKLYY